MEQFLRNFKTQKERSKDRNNKIKCIVKNKLKNKFVEKNSVFLETQKIKSNEFEPIKINKAQQFKSIPEGEMEETRNLNDELNKILNRMNSGSQLGSQYSSDSQNIGIIKTKFNNNNKESLSDYYQNNNFKHLKKENRDDDNINKVNIIILCSYMRFGIKRNR